MKKELAVDYRKASDLKPYAKNSRVHSEAQVAQIAASIKEFGFTQPILVDGKNGVIAGHGRLMAALSIGMAQVPVIELSGLTAAQKRAYVIADNKLTENGGWDDALLADELKALGEMGFDLELTGFEDIKLISFLAGGESNDPGAHWTGMPEFDQEDKTAYRSIQIHFKDQASVDQYAELIGQKITEKTRFVWFPEIEIETYADKRYSAESEE